MKMYVVQNCRLFRNTKIVKTFKNGADILNKYARISFWYDLINVVLDILEPPTFKKCLVQEVLADLKMRDQGFIAESCAAL